MKKLYVAHCLFDNLQVSPRNPEYGRLTCLVEASNEKIAADKLRRLIRKAVPKTRLLKNGMKVYLHEISELPAAGVVTRVESSEGRPPAVNTISVPYPQTGQLDVFGWSDNPEAVGAVRMTPFLEITRKK